MLTTTATKGNAAEAATLRAFIARGLDVLVPFGAGHPYDLLVDLGASDFLGVQCKCAREVDGCVVFNGRSTDHGRGRVTYQGRADVLAAYFQPLDTVYIVPVGPTFVPRLRVRPPRNNQRRGVRLAADYALDKWWVEALAEIVSRKA